MSKKRWTTSDMPDLTGKIIIVAGGNSGLGFESVKAFAKKGAEVILACRAIEKGENAKAEILQQHPDGKIEVVLHWESAGYGMIIQTTGRNYRETWIRT